MAKNFYFHILLFFNSSLMKMKYNQKMSLEQKKIQFIKNKYQQIKVFIKIKLSKKIHDDNRLVYIDCMKKYSSNQSAIDKEKNRFRSMTTHTKKTYTWHKMKLSSSLSLSLSLSLTQIHIRFWKMLVQHHLHNSHHIQALKLNKENPSLNHLQSIYESTKKPQINLRKSYQRFLRNYLRFISPVFIQ